MSNVKLKLFSRRDFCKSFYMSHVASFLLRGMWQRQQNWLNQVIGLTNSSFEEMIR